MRIPRILPKGFRFIELKDELKTSDLLQEKILGYRADETGQVVVELSGGREERIECGNCGTSDKWFIPPGPKQGLTVICNQCYTTSVFIIQAE